MVTLSIIVPVFNVEQTLERCLKSIAEQSFTDWEAILVDDGSPDDCPIICDEWAKNDSRFRVVHKSNGGLSDARNAGIDCANGKYITFVDSDDFLDPSTYEQVIPLIEDADIVEFPIYRFYGSTKQELLQFCHHTYNDMGRYWLEGGAYNHTYACNKLFRRELFSEVRFPVGKVFEDIATLPQLLQHAQKVVTTDRGLYYYCMNTNGITSQAQGHELKMLLESHLNVISHWYNDDYYMHVLNIQMDVYELTGETPLLPRRYVNPFSKGLSFTQRVKAITLNLLGIKGICKLNKITHNKRR